MQRKVLEDKKKEIEKLRGWGTESHDTEIKPETESLEPEFHPRSYKAKPYPIPQSSAVHVKFNSRSNKINPHSHSANVTNSVPTPTKRITPSSSRKRHASIFEARTRQLVEEEGHAFKQQVRLPGPAQKGVWSQKDRYEDGGVKKERSELLGEGRGSSAGGRRLPDLDRSRSQDSYDVTISQGRSEVKYSAAKTKKRVRFAAEAVVLNAALEGNLDLLKQCTLEVSHGQNGSRALAHGRGYEALGGKGAGQDIMTSLIKGQDIMTSCVKGWG